MKDSVYIVWQNENITGVSIIDNQHQGIIATINSLYFFIQNGYGLEGLKPTLDIMKGYMGFHMKTEELILTKNNYPMIDEYKKENNKLLNEFKNIADEAVLHKDPGLLLRFLKEMWFTHIRENHKQYLKYLEI